MTAVEGMVAVVIGAVVFDVGECLIDETREYGTWADWLGVPRHVFSAVFGAGFSRYMRSNSNNTDSAHRVSRDDPADWFRSGPDDR
jgi:hypothetical protein